MSTAIEAVLANKELRCLSVRQPWAYLIVSGRKKIENRSKRIVYRGPVLIHASGTRAPRHAWDWAEEHYNVRLKDDLPLGGIVGMATITDCVEDSKDLSFEGPFGWVLSKQKKLPFVACKGWLNLYPPKPEVLRKLRRALAA